MLSLAHLQNNAHHTKKWYITLFHVEWLKCKTPLRLAICRNIKISWAIIRNSKIVYGKMWTVSHKLTCTKTLFPSGVPEFTVRMGSWFPLVQFPGGHSNDIRQHILANHIEDPKVFQTLHFGHGTGPLFWEGIWRRKPVDRQSLISSSCSLSLSLSTSFSICVK